MQYDCELNMVQKSEGSNFWRYGFDYENRLTSASTRKQSVRYKYDALGRRVHRAIAGGKENTKYTYDGQDVLLDDNAGTLTKYQNGPGIDNKLRQTVGSTASYFLSDHLGSTNGLANSSGALTAMQSYDSFGNPTNTAFPSRYQFTGREFDSFSGLQFSRARFYDPNLGRFISEDPIGINGGDVNLYGYVWNNPLAYTDPSGKFPVVLVPIAIAAGALILASPSYVNAPGLGDPVYREENALILNAATGAIGGVLIGTTCRILGSAAGRFGRILPNPNKFKVPPPDYPIPPKWTPEWRWRFPEGTAPSKPRWFDPKGGGWRWHPQDKWHPKGHWDQNPWTQWNSPWTNIDP